MKTRIKVIFFVISFLFASLFVRAFYLQIVPNQKIENWMEKQFHSNIKVNPKRPSIIDSNGRDIAVSVETYSIYADPSLIKKHYWVAKRLAVILNEPYKSILKKLKQKESRFVWLKRFLPKELRDKVHQLKLSEGIGSVAEYKRLYPNDKMLNSTIGRVGVDGNGLSGVELWLDQFIDISSEFHRIPKDAKGRPLAISEKYLHELISEKEVQLTIDVDIQHYFEKRIKQARTEQDAKAAFAVVLELPSQEIKAIAYDSNIADDKKNLKNPLLSNVYEFGSVLKPISIGAALASGAIKKNWIVNLEGGTIKIGNRTIREAHYDSSYPSMSLSQIMAKSSNIGTAKAAFRLGDERLYQAITQFNLNQKTGIGLPGESRGILSAPPWSKHLLANISFGQGIAISPMQLLQAWSGLATDGMIRTPVLVKKWRNSVTGENVTYSSRELQQALPHSTILELRKHLIAVTAAGGTGERASIAGYQVAGKTGTAQKAFENGRGYKPGAYVTSFAGYFPANSPKYVMIVAFDEPQKDYYASKSAAPLFSELGTYLVRKQGVKPSEPKVWENHLANQIRVNRSLQAQVRPPPEIVAGMPLAEALEYLKEFDLPLRVRGQGELVVRVEADMNPDTEEPESITIMLE